MNLPTNVSGAIRKLNAELKASNIEGIVVVVSGPVPNLWHTGYTVGSRLHQGLRELVSSGAGQLLSLRDMEPMESNR